ncbi:FAD-dependent oxidoreductase [Deinococcus lacus]|uniref:FAD-dependent oxidoreductase n=1 Tax=Deinococcus lacus TaxID=392561 RepID=A0ABW1YAP1_9DEIO
MSQPSLLVVGGGIAGASVAYWAAEAGAAVTLIDSGEAAASQVPAALLNPVRGQSGKVTPQMVAGLNCTWALIAALERAGYAPAHGQTGVQRPVPDGRTRATFERHLAALGPEAQPLFRWVNPPATQAAWHSALEWTSAGWVDGAALTQSLVAASGASVLRGQVTRWGADWAEVGGSVLRAGATVWCGGARGTEWGPPGKATGPAAYCC